MSEEEDVEMYLARFEHRMKSLEIPQNRWVDNLRPLMSIWAVSTVDALKERDRDSYPKVKELLLTAYASIKGLLGHRVLAPQRQKGQNISQFLSQQQRLWNHWMEGLTPAEIEALSRRRVVTTGVQDPTTDEQTQTITEMVSEVEQFFAGRSSSCDDPKWTWRKPTYQPGSDNSRMKEDKATIPSSPSIPPRKTENTPATRAGDARYWAGRTCYYIAGTLFVMQ